MKLILEMDAPSPSQAKRLAEMAIEVESWPRGRVDLKEDLQPIWFRKRMMEEDHPGLRFTKSMKQKPTGYITQTRKRFDKYVVPGLRAYAAELGFKCKYLDPDYSGDDAVFECTNGWYEVKITIPVEWIQDCMYEKMKKTFVEELDGKRFAS